MTPSAKRMPKPGPKHRPPLTYSRLQEHGHGMTHLYEFRLDEKITNYLTPGFNLPFVNPPDRRVFDVTWATERREARVMQESYFFPGY
eukprot:10846135-Karenia_brevis.AAC.1